VDFAPFFVSEIAEEKPLKTNYFWEKHSCKKFRIIFESDEIIIGADRKNKYRTFRKDTGLIAFSRREAIETRLMELTGNQLSEVKPDAKNNRNRRWSNRNFIGCEFA
jgi:hypothetical protein